MAKATSVQQIFDNICEVFQPEKAQNDKATIQFDFSGANGGKYWVKVENGICSSGSGSAPSNPDMTLLSSADDWVALSNGDLKAMEAFMAGKVKVQGSMGLALKLQNWFRIG